MQDGYGMHKKINTKARNGNTLSIDYKGYLALNVIFDCNSLQLYMQRPPPPKREERKKILPYLLLKEITYLHEI